MKKGKITKPEAKVAESSTTKQKKVTTPKVTTASIGTPIETPAPKKSKTSKTIKSKENKKLDNVNAAKVVEKVITKEKELKYIYPAEVNNLPLRKKFRAEVRRKLKAFEKEVYKLEMSNLPEDQVLYEKKLEEFEAYKVKVLVNI